MYQLESPPPRSQFRRPWSPEPFDPTPRSDDGGSQRRLPAAAEDDYNSLTLQASHLDHDFSRYPPSQLSRFIHAPSPHSSRSRSGVARREASDSSVEALDLADYARTLRQRQFDADVAMDPYPAHYPSGYYRQPLPQFFAEPHALVDSISLRAEIAAPPSAYRPLHSPPASTTTRPLSSNSYYHDPFTFRSWSHTWNDGSGATFDTRSPPSAYTHASSSQPYDPSNRADSDTNSGPGTKQSIFDPGYVHNPFTDEFGTRNVHDTYHTPPPSFGHDEPFGTVGRNTLPWSQDPPEYGRQLVDPAVQEERMRMLERKFGTPNDPGNASKVKGKKKDAEDAFLDENGQPLIGTVNDRGYLVTQGPKKRLLVRLMQVVLAAGAAIPAIYAAAVMKTEKSPPPAGKPPAYILYAVSVLTFLFTVYLFICRPCCCPPRRKPRKAANPFASNGMMVLPVQGLPGGGGKNAKNKSGGKKWKKGETQPPGDVQVNLIVDPSAFGRQDESSSSDSSSDEEFGSDWDWDGSMSGGVGDGSSSGWRHGSHKTRPKKKGRRKPPKRRSIFAGLAMEEDWKKARGWLKKMTAVDVVMLVIWGGVFTYIIIGQRCPSGMFDGWCDAYNVSTAAACLLAVAFGIHVFFDIQDLGTSKISPRMRV